jgi:alanine racemase
MLKQNCRAWLEIDLGAVRHNVKNLKSLLADSTELMAVVKADGYGHGAIAISQAVLEAGATWLGVATIMEGVQLRNAGITAPILILGATNSVDEIRAIANYRLHPTICTTAQAIIFNQTLSQECLVNSDQPLSIHLKIDTGMSRLGTNWQEAEDFIKRVWSLSHLKIHSVYSHLATADELDGTILDLQHQRFKEVINVLNKLKIDVPSIHFANTAGVMNDESLHYDMVRCGLGVYGFYPAPHLKEKVKDNSFNSFSLRSALQVKARITQIKDIETGTGVSYGYTFIAPQNLRIATVAIGYADGVPRSLSNRIVFALGDRRTKQIGTITMDQCLIDITDIPDVEIGDVVTILGNDADNNADRWAEITDTIAWEILCGFKNRLPRLITR